MLKLTLDCGREVSVSNFDMSHTYSCLIEGRPNERLNDEIIQDAITARESAWGQRKVHVIPPEIDWTDPEHPQLPPVLLRVWLNCYQPVNGDAMSELVVIWFTNECYHRSIGSVIYDAIRGLPWLDVAADCDYS